MERLKKKCVRYVLREFGWMTCEERFNTSKEFLGYAAEDLFYQKKIEESLSLIKRNNLIEEGFIKKTETLDFFQNPKNLIHYNVLPNLIFEADSFNPIEENMKINDAGTHLNLKEFGFGEKNIHFIDKINDDFFVAESDLLNSIIV